MAGGWWLDRHDAHGKSIASRWLRCPTSEAGGWWLVTGDWWSGIERTANDVRENTAETAIFERCHAVVSTIWRGTTHAPRMCMTTVKTYRDLEAWQVGMTSVERCYAATKSFPPDERFGLTAQLRRAAVSIPLSLAEGACRRTTNAYINHVSIALGSHGELETLIEIAFRLGYLKEAARDELFKVSDSTGRLLNGLLRSLVRTLHVASTSASECSIVLHQPPDRKSVV